MASLLPQSALRTRGQVPPYRVSQGLQGSAFNVNSEPERMT